MSLALLTAAEPVHAARFAVNSSHDESDDNPGDGVCRSTPSHQCTLRAAIVETNALTGADVIAIPAMTIHLHIIGSDDQGLLGDLDIRQDLRITGAGAGLTVIDASRISPGERVFDIHPDLDVRLVDLKITGGRAQGNGAGGDGGGIRVGRDSELRMGSVVENNQASRSGGGIAVAAGGLARMHSSTVANNRASGDGGGISVDAGSVWIDGSTVSENTGRNGGAVWFASGGSLIVVISTISTNTAEERGGGFFVDVRPQTIKERQLYLFNTTVALKCAASPASGGNIFVGSDQKADKWTVSRTIVSNPRRGKNCVGQPLESVGYNLDSELSCSFNAAGDISNVDPRLRPLSFDNSTTKVHPLPSNSAAVDSSACLFIWDQRGISRPRDGNGDGVSQCDIGSYELIRPEIPGR